MAGFLDDLFSAPSDPTAVDPSSGLTQKQLYDTRMNTLGSIGGLLLAAGQPMMGPDRGRILAQLGNVPGQISEMQQRLLQNNKLAQENQLRQNTLKAINSPEMQQAISSMPSYLQPTAKALAASGSPEALAKLQEFLTPTIDAQGNYFNRATGIAGNIYMPGMERQIGMPGAMPSGGQPAQGATAAAAPAAPMANGAQAAIASPMTAPANPNAPVPKGEDMFKAMNVPPQIQAQVRAIVRGDEELPEGRAGMSSPQGMYLRQLVAMYDPDGYSNIVNGVRKKISTDFSPSGNSGQQIASAEKIVNHTVELQKAANDLGNGQYPLLNEARQFVLNNTGDNRVTNFNQWRTAVSEEVGKFLKGSGSLSDTQIGIIQKDIEGAGSPDQLQKSIDNVFDLMNGQLGPKLAQYETAMGKKYNNGQPFSKDTLDKLDYINSHPIPGSTKAAQMAAAQGAPQAGFVKGGYRFKGGNPADKNNWEKVQ